MEEEKGKGSDRWGAAILNLSEMGSNLESLQKLLLKKAVFVEEDAYAKASLTSEQARTIRALEKRVETLERELDAAITASARARSEKRQAEAAQRAAELHAQEVTRELENTTKVFELHMEELRVKQEVIARKDEEIKWLFPLAAPAGKYGAWRSRLMGAVSGEWGHSGGDGDSAASNSAVKQAAI
ncbi:hypothetical protein ACLOJK_035635 [Asimina triloba]